MSKPQLMKFDQFARITLQRYERYLPTAFDESLTLLEKMNKLIEYLNEMGILVNGVVEQWNEVMEWIVNDGVNDSVVTRLNEMVDDGTFATIINEHIFDDLNNRVNLKADKTYVDSELDTKADTTYVDAELDTKADTTYVDGELDTKADTTYVDTELGMKADKTYVNAELGMKADRSELQLKANQSYAEDINSRLMFVIAGLDGTEEFYTPVGLEQYMTTQGQEWVI